MKKITFIGAGSTVFAKNVLGDCMCSPALQDSIIALYDIDKDRLDDSYRVIQSLNENINASKATIKTYLGEDQRRDALKGADFVVNAIQVGGYEPSTKIDFDIPKAFGLEQTIGDTAGIGGIMRALRTIPVLEAIARDMEAVCPHAWFLNYTNPMAMLTGYMQRYTKVKTIGLCHSVQVCTQDLLKSLDMEDQLEGRKELIAGINHMGWLLSIENKDGQDLYPEIRRRAAHKNATEKHHDMVRFDYMDKFDHYCTESSEHNAEYNPYYIKSKYPERIEAFNIPLDEYPRRCVKQIADWEAQRADLLADGKITHTRTKEYASYIMEAITTNTPYEIGANVLNKGLIDNLPANACVEVPCLVNGSGIHPCRVGSLPPQLAALNQTNINPQLLTIEAAVNKQKKTIYQAVLLDPHASAELTPEAIIEMCDQLIEAHGPYMAMYQ